VLPDPVTRAPLLTSTAGLRSRIPHSSSSFELSRERDGRLCQCAGMTLSSLV
jgi:hypothetical protein